jgi:hypothetical protein
MNIKAVIGLAVLAIGGGVAKLFSSKNKEEKQKKVLDSTIPAMRSIVHLKIILKENNGVGFAFSKADIQKFQDRLQEAYLNGDEKKSSRSQKNYTEK